MAGHLQRLDFGPGWTTTNENLVELVDLFAGATLDWTPRPGEWSARTIFTHIIGARYCAPIPSEADIAHLPDIAASCGTAAGIQTELRGSWAMLERFLSDPLRLDAVYKDDSITGAARPAPPLLGSAERTAAGLDLGYVDHPDHYSGHYVAYHRFAHDLHHRSTLIGYLAELGVSLDGHRIRPL